MPCACRAIHQLCWPAAKTKSCRRMTDKGNWRKTYLLRDRSCLPNGEGSFYPSLLPFSLLLSEARRFGEELRGVRPALGRLWQGNGKLSSSIHSPTSPLLLLQAMLQTSRSLGILWMHEPSQNKLVKKKFQKKVTDPYGKCEPVNIKPWAKRHCAGALRPYAAQPCVVCQSKEYLILQLQHPGPASFLSLPTGIPQSQEGTYGGSSTSKMEQREDTFSSWGFHAGEGQIRAIGLGAHCKQPETSIYIVFPQTIGIPTSCMVCVCVSVCVNTSIFLFYRNYFLQEIILIYLGGIKKTPKPQTEKKWLPG